MSSSGSQMVQSEMDFSLRSFMVLSQAFQSVTEGTYVGLRSVFEAMRQNREYIRFQKELGAHKEAYGMMIDPGRSKAVQRELNRQGIRYLVMKASEQGKPMDLIFVADKNREKAQNITRRYVSFLENKGLVSDIDLMNVNNGRLLRYKDLTVEEAWRMHRKAEALGMRHSVVDQGGGKHMFSCALCDRDKAFLIAAAMAYDAAGPAKDVLRTRARFEQENLQKIRELNEKRDERSFYVIDLKGRTYHFSDKGLEILKGNGEVQMIQGEDAINEHIMRFSDPVVLSEGQYKRYESLDDDKKRGYLETVNAGHGDPFPGHKEELKKHDDERRLVMQKLCMGNSADDILENLLTNEEASVEDFMVKEKANIEYETDEARELNNTGQETVSTAMKSLFTKFKPVLEERSLEDYNLQQGLLKGEYPDPVMSGEECGDDVRLDEERFDDEIDIDREMPDFYGSDMDHDGIDDAMQEHDEPYYFY